MGSWKASTEKMHHRETALLLCTWEEGWLMRAVFKISIALCSGLTLTDIYSPLRKSHLSSQLSFYRIKQGRIPGFFLKPF